MTTILIRNLQNHHLLTQPEHDGDPMTVSDMLPDTSPLTKQSLDWNHQASLDMGPLNWDGINTQISGINSLNTFSPFT